MDIEKRSSSVPERYMLPPASPENRKGFHPGSRSDGMPLIRDMVLGATLAGLMLQAPSAAEPRPADHRRRRRTRGDPGFGRSTRSWPRDRAHPGAGADLPGDPSHTSLPASLGHRIWHRSVRYGDLASGGPFCLADPPKADGSILAHHLAQVDIPGPILSDGQFVWGPNVGILISPASSKGTRRWQPTWKTWVSGPTTRA